eukprot:GHVQ01023839.1.p1 GENE.GHVQ01023839.1~~GHVQ01023839.1.p1  ORF type:complete len:531 (+),score=62.94 GHVQ01023839.1:34-1626(+)
MSAQPAIRQRPAGGKRLQYTLKLEKALQEEACRRLEASKILLHNTEGYLETTEDQLTSDVTQRDILQSAGLSASKKAFNFSLSYGPYCLDYSRNGRYLLMGGRLGSISLLDCYSMDEIAAINVDETVRDVKILHNHTMFAVAQKKYLYMYDNQGIELHCLRDTQMTYKMEYLPYHFLLATVGELGWLTYQDISTGQIAAKHKVRKGACKVMCQNPYNAVIHLGHSRGTVTLWTPNIGKAVVEMLCHKGPVTAVKVKGNHMVTAGIDGSWRIWDIRNTYDCLSSTRYFGSPPQALDISQTGIVGLGFGCHVQLWNDCFTHNTPTPQNEGPLAQEQIKQEGEGTDGTRKRPFLKQDFCGQIVECLKFRPYEDVCAVGLDGGISTLIVPGAGRANFDSFEDNPFESKKQRSERQIHSLLEKLQPDMITLDPSLIATVDTAPRAVVEQERLHEKEEQKQSKRPKKEKHKMRGRSKADIKEKVCCRQRNAHTHLCMSHVPAVVCLVSYMQLNKWLMLAYVVLVETISRICSDENG